MDRHLLTKWAVRPGSRTYTHGSATAVATPELSHRDRLAVSGNPEDAAVAVRAALAEVGPSYRPIGEADLVKHIVAAIPTLRLVATFGWRWTTRPTGLAGATWLQPEESADISALIAAAWPDSYARPGVPGVTRWAGARAHDGRLAAVAADAWSSEQVGFLAGVATDASCRGHGHASAACALVIDSLLADHRAVALMVDSWNEPAIRLYNRLGMKHVPVAAARVIQ